MLNNLFRSMVNTIHPSQQDNKTYNFALNYIKNKDLTLSSDFGNTKCLSTNKIVGSVLINEDKVILFEVPNKVIEFIPSTCQSKILYELDCFNFSNLIQAIHVVENKCDNIIYFTDGVNPYRRLNLSKQYTNCNDIKFSPNLSVPYIPKISASSGGNLEVGTYQFAIRYLDEALSPTNFFFITNPVPVHANPTNNYPEIIGNYNIEQIVAEDYTVPLTDQSLHIDITNLDTSYAYYQLAAIWITSRTGKAYNYYLEPPQAINSDSDTYIYTGITNGTIATSLQEIIVNSSAINTVGTHELHNDRLFLADVSEDTIN